MSAEPLALLSSLSWGTADFAGGLASRRVAATTVTALSALAGLLLLVVSALVTGVDPDTTSVGLGAAAGAASSVALLCFYAALATGRMSVVAPVAATGVLVPVVAGVVRGDRPGALQAVGLVVAVVGVVLASGPERHVSGGRPLVLASAAAVGFGAVLTLLALGGRHDAASTLLASRTTLALVTGLLALRALRRSGRPGLRAPTVGLVLVAGFGDAGANVAYVEATRTGLLSVVSVLGSLYPVVTVLLARFVLKERLGGVQLPGVVLTLAGVVALAAG